MRIPIGPWMIRSYEDGDRDALVRYAGNRKIWINLRDRFPHPYTGAAADEWLERVGAQRPQSAFAIASPEELIGGIGVELGADVHRRSAEIGYWIAEPFWGRGIATLAVRAFTDYAFAAFDLVRIHAGVFEWNPASARALEKAGYVLEGRLRKSVVKDGKGIDELLYAIVRPERA